MRHWAVLLWPALTCALLIEMIPFETEKLGQEDFETKYADVGYPVRFATSSDEWQGLVVCIVR